VTEPAPAIDADQSKQEGLMPNTPRRDFASWTSGGAYLADDENDLIVAQL